MELLWKDSGEHFQAYEEKLSYLWKGDLAIAAVPGVEKGLNRLFDGFNRSVHNLSNPVMSCLTRKNYILLWLVVEKLITFKLNSR